MASKPRSFRPVHLGTVKQERMAYEVRRGSARDRGYTSRWDKAAVTYKRDNPLCIGCEAVDRVELAKVVDHIIPHKGDQKLFWNTANWQACCAKHHDIVKQYLERQFEQGLLIEADLKLTSPAAKAATLRLMPRVGGGGRKFGGLRAGTGGWIAKNPARYFRR